MLLGSSNPLNPAKNFQNPMGSDRWKEFSNDNSTDKIILFLIPRLKYMFAFVHLILMNYFSQIIPWVAKLANLSLLWQILSRARIWLNFITHYFDNFLRRNETLHLDNSRKNLSLLSVYKRKSFLIFFRSINQPAPSFIPSSIGKSNLV